MAPQYIRHILLRVDNVHRAQSIMYHVVSEADCLEPYLYEYVVVLNHQRADVDVSRKWVVPVGFCAHLSSACDVLHICHVGRYTEGVRGL